MVDLNDVAAGGITMVRRLIGEDIEVSWTPASEPWPVRVDPSQVHQVLTNLAANARDAIAGSGRIVIATENVVLDEAWCAARPGSAPGEHVSLTVADSGPGMSEEALRHLFEPFFTTKGVGRGTGLGLATVYGIVKQNGGFIDAGNAPSGGAVFRIYFPRAAASAGSAPVPESGEEPRGHETILVVEDDAGILSLTRGALAKLGYAVLGAHAPGEAIEIAERQEGEIHLLLTDVVMPGMSGPDLRDAISRRRPGLKTLFMSGYTADMIARRGIVDPAVRLLQKPFTRAALASAVRSAIDGT